MKNLWLDTKLNALACLKSKTVNERALALAHPVTHRLFKELIIKEKALKGCDVYSDMVKELYTLIVKNLKKLLSTRVIFLVIGFIEGGTSYKSKVS